MRFKKGIIYFVTVVFILNTLVVGPAFADSLQTTGSELTVTTETEEVQNGAAEADTKVKGISPDSPLYFLDKFLERLQLLAAFSQEAKAKLEAKLAEERLSEAEQLVLKNKIEKLERVIEDYSRHIEKAQDRLTKILEENKDWKDGEGTGQQIKKISTEKLEALAELLAKLPQPCRDKLLKKMEEILARQEALDLAVELSTELIADEEKGAEEEQDEKQELAEEKEESASGGNEEGAYSQKEEGASKENKKLNNKKKVYQEIIKKCRAENYGYGEIALLISLAKKMAEAEQEDEGKVAWEENQLPAGFLEKIEELMAYRRSGMGWGEIARKVGLQPGKKADKLAKVLKKLDKAEKTDDSAGEDRKSEQDLKGKKKDWQEEKKGKLEEKKVKKWEKEDDKKGQAGEKNGHKKWKIKK
ncbi:MAG TPA: hypothetical protein GXX38_03460 [Clostridia bacterium]|jgi:hypothetical protein|nr:hypothetical protein [Clostridia bacterium]